MGFGRRCGREHGRSSGHCAEGNPDQWPSLSSGTGPEAEGPKVWTH